MFVQFFSELKQAGLPVSVTEYLTLMRALEQDLAGRKVEEFYYLARATLVKDERNIDRFDQVFGHVFKGLEALSDTVDADIPEEWLRKVAELNLSDEDKAKIEALGGWDKLMETLRERLKEQQGRHQGGSKWIGTGGTSPFGAYGYNPEGIRIGQDGNRNFSAVKVWDKREFKDLDDSSELGTRNLKMALRKLSRILPAPARPRSLTSTAPSKAPPGRAGSIWPSGPSGAMRSRCCCSSMSAAPWIGISPRPKSCFPPPAPSSRPWNISTSTTACTRACGRTTPAAGRSVPPHGTCCTPTPPTTRSSLWATRP
jgi:hypothetical protein